MSRVKTARDYGISVRNLRELERLGLVRLRSGGGVDEGYEGDLRLLASLMRLVHKDRAIGLALALKGDHCLEALQEIERIALRAYGDALTLLRLTKNITQTVLPLHPSVYRLERSGVDPDTHAEMTSAQVGVGDDDTENDTTD